MEREIQSAVARVDLALCDVETWMIVGMVILVAVAMILLTVWKE